MSSIVISNRSIQAQRLGNIENSKVFLPFNISKNQVEKLKELLNKVKVTFLASTDKLEIEKLSFDNVNVKSSARQIPNSRFTLPKTYVVTMKKNFISKVSMFYNRITAPVVTKNVERSVPVFDIARETNLQEALQEATVEIDLSKLNASLNAERPMPEDRIEQPTQVLANNIQDLNNSFTVNNHEQLAVEPQDRGYKEQQINMPKTNPLPVNQTSVEPMVTNPTDTNSVNQVDTPKIKTKKVNGYVLAIPIIIVWLGAVLIGTVKLVTNILS